MPKYNIMNKPRIIAASLTVMLFSAIHNGFALSILWRWFITPSLGAPALTTPYAIGIALMVSYMIQEVDLSKEDKAAWTSVIADGVFLAVLRPGFAVCVGWVITLFI